MARFFLAILASVVLTAAAAAEVTSVIPLPAAAAAPSRPFKYTLLPDPADLTPGNAASLWRQAYQASREAKVPFGEKEYKWISREETPLKDFPRKEVREHLDKIKTVLRLADQAARRSSCDWDYPPLTIQSVGEGLPALNEVQTAREMATLLSLRFRLELAEGRYDDAARTLQTGFSLSRQLGEYPSLIQNLVAVAITSIMLGRVEEWMQQPDAPNLYWALTALPAPFLDVRKPVEYELGTFPRSFPGLKQADKPGMKPEEAQKLAEEVFGAVAMFSGDLPGGGLLAKLSATLTVPFYLPEAKKYLIAHGRKKEDVEA